MARYTRTEAMNQADTTWQGDDLSSSKDPNTTRIQFHNVNGISLRGPEGLDMFVNEQISLNIDIQGITEHCLDTTKFPVYQTARETVRQQVQGLSLLALASSQESAINLYKPGGTGFLLLGEVVSRLEPNGIDQDPMGRWTCLHLRRKNLSPLTIITAYQVCPRPTNSLGNTAYHQQIRALSARGTPNIHPRRAFIQDMESCIQLLQDRGHDIILGGDFNESLMDRHSGISKLITTLNLTDPFLSRFPHHSPFGTHVMGTRRIDMVFVSPAILPCIQRIGYAPFQYSKPSDHRPLIIDFNTRALFGYSTCPMPGGTNRMFQTKDKVAVTRFITAWYQQISERNGFALKIKLDDDTATPEDLEAIDQIVGTSGQIAERKCKHRRPEFYSQRLVQQRLKVSILRGHLRSMLLGVDRTDSLRTRMTRYGLEFPLPPTIRATKQLLHGEQTTLQQLCRDNEELRLQELTEKIEAATRCGQKTKSQALKSIRKFEAHRKTYQILQKMKRKTLISSQLDRVEIPASWPPPHSPIHTISNLEDPKSCTDWITITEPNAVEYYLMLRNRLHFGQAEGTPFTMEPLCTELDWAASTNAAQLLLQGTYPSEHAVPNCEDLLRECRCASALDAVPAELSADDFRGKIKAWKESTTTSPSGRHLGWYRSLFSTGVTSEQDTEDHNAGLTLLDMQDSISSLLLAMINYCIRNTYVLERWKKIVNVMIFKDQGNFKIHRLRVIHIYEADFNLLLAVKWRQLLHTADRNQLIHEGQYGGRPGCEAQSLTLLEELKYDLAHLTRRTLFHFDNDAASCYDRIVVPLASVINRKYGLHRNVVAIHANTLRAARYHLKTALGISEDHYSTCDEYPIHGTGQGSGNSPSIWLFISSTLFEIHSKNAYGAKFTSPDGQCSVKLSMVGFVDDSTGTLNDFQPQSEAPILELLRRMQSDAQLWNNLLFSTGGKLELTKCSFHVLHFDFRPNGTPVATIDLYENRIHVNDLETHQNIPIQSKRSFDPHKTLGHLKSPTSRAHHQLQILREKADRIAELLSVSPLTRQGAYLAYHTVYNPSIKYVLPQSFFTHQELNKAQARSLHRIIAKCGYNRHTARAIMFAPVHYGGGGFLPWYLLQGEGQVVNFIKHWRTDTLISKTLRVAVQWAQWQSGHPESIFEDVTSPIPYLECRWLRSLRDFLGTINGSLELDLPIVASRERDNDIYIMKYAHDCGLFTDKDLAIINYCRLYLHVTTVSELFDASGTKIIPQLFHCEREPWFNPSTYITLQKRPSNYQIKMQWQRLCRQWTTADGSIGSSYKFGSWTSSGRQLRRWRQSYAIPHQTDRIYSWIGNCYWEFHRQSTFLYRPAKALQWTPTSSAIPIEVLPLGDGTVRITTTCKFHSTIPLSIHIPANFHQYIRTLSKWEQFLLEGIHLVMSPHVAMHHIRHNLEESTNLLAVSDGSMKNGHITYGWVLGSDDGIIYAKHYGPGVGAATSHRAEAWGMLSISTFLHHLFQYTQGNDDEPQNQLSCTFISDNSGLVQRVHQRLSYIVPYPNATLAPDWDILEQINQVIRQLKFQEIHIQWIKGHQDDGSQELSVAAKYNILADSLADLAFYEIPFHTNLRVVLPEAKCSLFLNNQMIQGHYVRAIRETYTIPPYKKYIATRHEWTQDQDGTVDWELFQRTISVTSHHVTPVQLTKFLHDKLPTRTVLSKNNPHQSKKCPHCDADETFSHILSCHNHLSTEFRSNLCASVAIYMDDHDFPDIIKTEFLECLHACLHSDLPLDTIRTPTKCRESQLKLGTRSLPKGLLTTQWRQSYTNAIAKYTNEPVTNSLEKFAGLIQIIWLAQLKLWETYLNDQFTELRSPTNTQCDRHSMYQRKIRDLYTKQELCLPGHREKYFPEDLESYLQTSTTTQLRQYLHHYEPAILQSIKLAQQQPLQTLFTFPGFLRHRFPQTQTIQCPHTTQPTPVTIRSPPTQPYSIGARGAPLHHKHTRWRWPQIPQSQSIRQYFSPKEKPPD